MRDGVPKAMRRPGGKRFFNWIIPGRQPRVEPRMRRQHLAVGVSPWKRMLPLSRVGGGSMKLWASAHGEPLSLEPRHCLGDRILMR